MLRKTLASARIVRICVFGLVTFTSAAIFTDTAEARRYRHRHSAGQEARESYSPAFSSIIVDGNSGATLSANNPDASRHPASLTKMMTLYMLFERLESRQDETRYANGGFPSMRPSKLPPSLACARVRPSPSKTRSRDW